LKLKCGEPLSNVAFNFGLCRYTVVAAMPGVAHAAAAVSAALAAGAYLVPISAQL
jgi:hypothetical protein